MTQTETREPWWVHHADHMKGWEAFGVTALDKREDNPIVRRLGMVTHPKKGKGPTTEEKPGTTPFGPGEVKLGVAAVEFSTSADSIGSAFIHVLGTDEADVRARWFTAAAVFAEIAPRLWPKTRGSGGTTT